MSRGQLSGVTGRPSEGRWPQVGHVMELSRSLCSKLERRGQVQDRGVCEADQPRRKELRGEGAVGPCREGRPAVPGRTERSRPRLAVGFLHQNRFLPRSCSQVPKHQGFPLGGGLCHVNKETQAGGPRVGAFWAPGPASGRGGRRANRAPRPGSWPLCVRDEASAEPRARGSGSCQAGDPNTPRAAGTDARLSWASPDSSPLRPLTCTLE